MARCRVAAALLLCVASLPMVTSPVATDAATVINGHTVVLDGSGKIVPWTTNPADGYDTVVKLAWNYLLNSVPNDPSTGRPAYFSQSYLNPDTQAMAGWPNNPAGMFAMLIESAQDYYDYSGNAAVMTLARSLADQMLTSGMTSATDNWSKVPYASGDAGSLTYQGASYGDSTGVGDGRGFLEPDKIGELGGAFLQLYEFSGDTRYRDAAIDAADALVAHIRSGDASHSPWPFRVNAETGAIREQYSASVIGPIGLFDELIRLGLGSTANYQTARSTAWTWMMTYPMQNNVWTQYFEDVPVQSDYANNINQLSAMMTARYLLLHPSMDPSWETHVRGLISWVEANFGVSDSGATIVREQAAFAHPMGSHTSRYASVNALLYEKTGDLAAKEEAYRSLNWATYMARSSGVVIDGPTVNNQWFTDGYGDYVRHFLTALGAVPEWSPAGQTHLTRSSSVLTSIAYSAGAVSYTTSDTASTEVLRLAFTPNTVTVDGQALDQRPDLNGPGWVFDGTTGVLRVRHDVGTHVQILAGEGQNVPPVVALTSPADGTTYTAPASVDLAATATDPDGTIAQVDFYSGATLIGSATQAPYTFTWSNVGAGTYSLSARATDNLGATSTSPTVSITVNEANPNPLPAPWVSADVGPVGVAGSATYASGVFTVKGSGVDIWSTADSFHFVYQPLAGDGQIVARVVSQQDTDPWALAGVMIRETLAAGSREAITAITPDYGASFTWRSATNASSNYTSGGTAVPPYWVRLARSGNTFTAYKSSNGTTWTQIAQTTITMTTNVFIGLAVTSHDNAVLATDTFDNVVVSVAADTTPPTISAITASGISQNGATIAWTTNEPSDSQVEYGKTTAYGSSTALDGSLVTAHSLVVSGLDAATTYHYRVKSKDAAGNLATSGDNTFSTPTPPDLQAPTAPTDLVATSVTPTSVGLSWGASSDNVGVTGYRIRRDGVQIGTTTGATTYADQTVSPQTSYSYSVVAVDAAANESLPSNTLSVTTPASSDVTPPSAPTGLATSGVTATTVNLVWNASTDDVAVTGYDVYRDGVQIGTATDAAFVDDDVAPLTTYAYRVVAFDAAGNVSPPSATLPVTTSASTTTAVVVDTTVTTKQTQAARQIASPAFTTASANELLVAFITSDGPKTSKQSFSRVTGGGLTWTLRQRANSQGGTAEVWQAYATTVVNNLVVSATRSRGSYEGMITVVAFQNASPDRTTATARASAPSGAATTSLVTTRPNVLVWGVGNDWDGATARTLADGQTMISELLSQSGDTFWVQRRTDAVPLSGTTVTIGTIAPTNHRWNLVAIEIAPPSAVGLGEHPHTPGHGSADEGLPGTTR